MHWTVRFPTSELNSSKKKQPNNILEFKINEDVAESFASNLNYTCIKQQWPVTLLKRDSSKGVFLWNLQNF